MTRDKIVTVRLSDEERAAWQTAADADQRKISDWIRVVVNAHLRKTAEPTPRTPRKKG